MKKFFLFLLLNLLFASGFCQDHVNNYENLSVQQGLADNSINCIIQDQTGFIWIGGNNGLYKYDGYDFTLIKTKENCTNCPSFNKVFTIRQDKNGLLWLVTDDGIILFNPENEKIRLIYQISWDEDHLRSKLNNGIAIDSDNNLWSINQTGLVKISYLNSLKTHILKDSIFTNPLKNTFNIELIQLASEKYDPENKALSLTIDREQNIWAGCMAGLYVKTRNNETFVRADVKSGLRNVTDILQQDENSFWLISDTKLFLLTYIKDAIHKNPPDVSLFNFTEQKQAENNNSLCLLRDHQNNFLLGTTNDLYKIRKDDNSGRAKFESVHHEDEDSQNENFKQIQYIFEDRTGLIWAAGLHNGISKFNLSGPGFTSYNSFITKTLRNHDVNSIFKDFKNSLWIGVAGEGLLKISPENKKVTLYDTGIPIKRILCLIESSPGILLVGLYPGILEFNSATGLFTDPLPETKTAENLRATGAVDLLQDGDWLYICTLNGLFILNIQNKKLYQFTFSKNDASIDLGNSILSVIKLRSGDIFISSCYNGINKVNFNPQDGSISLVPVVTDKLLKDNGIIDVERHRIFEDSKGMLWIANYSGLHSISLKNKEIKNYSLIENVRFPQAWSITEDDNNNLWLGTHKGLCRFNTLTGRVKVFDSNDGLPVTIHGFNSVYKDKNGRMFFGGIGGFYSFHPDSLKTNDSIPPVAITDFRISNKSIKPDSSGNTIITSDIAYTNSIKLKHNQNDLSFQFAALDYNQSFKNKYLYRLEGLQHDWIQANANNRSVNYTNLRPGVYTFMVKASNNEGVWNEKGVALPIIIEKPWWTTFPAWAAYFIALFGSVSGFIYYRLSSLKKEKLILEYQVAERTNRIEEQKEEILLQRDKLEDQNQKIMKLDELKNRFFTNISHEFRTPLTLIQSPVEELLDDPERNEKERRKLNMVRRNTKRLLNLVNQLLDISKIDMGSMKLELIQADVISHLKYISATFTSLAETKQISFVMHFPPENLTTWFDPDKIEKIIVNLLSNAFKFTPEGGVISLNAWYSGNYNPAMDTDLVFTVTDTGMGIPLKSLGKVFDRFYQAESSSLKDTVGTGIGLSLTHELVTLMHGEISVESEENKGSTFRVRLPLGKEHLKDSEYLLLKDFLKSSDFFEMSAEKMEFDNEENDSISNEGKPVLLIVEDNMDVRMHIADNFSREYIIHQANDGISGLKKALELIPDIVITDLMMPRSDGLELCVKLKNDERTSHIPVIMLTAKVTIEDKITGLQTGADDYIPKPFNMSELKVRTKNLIEQRTKLRERFRREITLEPHDISITPLDERFLTRAIEIVENHIKDENFDMAELRDEMNMSRSTLFRKLHALTGQSPTEFIRSIRLKRAANLLIQKFGNVTQVAMEAGFNNLSYFNRTFKKLFGVSPLDYAKQKSEETDTTFQAPVQP